jgi:hypothetical protein
MRNVYVLNTQILGRLKYRKKKNEDVKHKNPVLDCMYCRKELKLGEKIYSISRTNHGKRYHYKCAQMVNII